MGQLSGCILNGCKKEVNAMTCDESLYRQYLSGDDAGLEALMKKYGDPLTLYIDGYLHDVHEAEELMLDVFAYLFTKKPRIRDGGFKAYLYKAARHMALRHKSRRKTLFSLDTLTGEPDGRLLALLMEKLLRRDAMGGGDIKLLFLTGLFLGWQKNLLCLLLACVVGILWGLVRAKRGQQGLPWGPGIALAAWSAALFGQNLIDWYLSLL